MSDVAAPVPLPWQEQPWLRLQQQRARNELPHALLLAGPAGVGKRQFAAALASALLCLTPRADGTACGTCRGCTLMAAGSHPDWFWVQPEERGKAIKIDQVRAVVEQVAQTAQQGGRKLIIIEPAEALNRASANALLKTLEEPSGNAVILLVADAPGRLLPTLRSRCQRLEFPLPAEALTRAWLAPLALAGQLEPALAEAGGRPLRARALLDGDVLRQRREQASALSAVLAGAASPLPLAEAWQALEWDDLLEWLTSQVTRAVRLQAGAQAASDELIDALARLPATALFALLDRILALTAQTRAGSNPNRQLALEGWLLCACDALSNKTS